MFGLYFRFKINTYFTVLDQITASFNNRFNGAREVLKDLTLLSPKRLIECAENKLYKLPIDSFTYIAQWIDGINHEQLISEYIAFSKCFTELINSSTLPTTLHKCQPNEAVVSTDEEMISSDDGEESIGTRVKSVIDPGTKNETTILDVMQLLSNHDLHTAFPNLFLAYQGLCTLPASSSSAERSFSKVFGIIELFLIISLFFSFKF